MGSIYLILDKTRLRKNFIDEIIFLLKVNKYNGIIIRPYNHAAIILTPEFQAMGWNSHMFKKFQTIMRNYLIYLPSMIKNNKNTLKH